MIEFVEKVLMAVGFVTVGLVVFFWLLMAKDYICKLVAKKRWEYKFKHRFDKKPVAKCYCKDCKYFEEKAEKCTFFRNWYVLDNWFCSNAKPKKYDSEK